MFLLVGEDYIMSCHGILWFYWPDYASGCGLWIVSENLVIL